MITTSLFCSSVEHFKPKPHDCLQSSMKIAETVASVALLIIGLITVFSYPYPPAASYALAWVAGTWILVNLLSFVIPFLCRNSKKETEDRPRSPLFKRISRPATPESEPKAEGRTSPLAKKNSQHPATPTNPPRGQPIISPRQDGPTHIHSPKPLRPMPPSGASAFTPPARRTATTNPPARPSPFIPPVQAQETDPFLMRPQAASPSISPSHSPFPPEPREDYAGWADRLKRFGNESISVPPYVPNPPNLPVSQGRASNTPSPTSMQQPPGLIQPIEEVPILIQHNTEDCAAELKKYLDDAYRYIEKHTDDKFLESELKDDFQNVLHQAISDEDKCVQMIHMYNALFYYIGTKSYTHSTFPILPIANPSGRNCHYIAALQALAHTHHNDYLLWRPFRKPKKNYISLAKLPEHVAMGVTSLTSKDKDNPLTQLDEAHWKSIMKDIPDDATLMTKMRYAVEELRAGVIPKIPEWDFGYHYWWLDRLGMVTYAVSPNEIRCLAQEDWSVLLLDSSSKGHYKVIIKKSDEEWFLVDDAEKIPLNADYDHLQKMTSEYNFYVIL